MKQNGKGLTTNVNTHAVHMKGQENGALYFCLVCNTKSPTILVIYNLDVLDGKFLKLSLPLAANVATRGTRSDREKPCCLLAGCPSLFSQNFPNLGWQEQPRGREKLADKDIPRALVRGLCSF